MTPRSKDPYADPSSPSDINTNDEKALCYVCETDLTPFASGRKGKEGKDEKGKEGADGKDGKEKGGKGVVELRTEGTGFAGGGKNIAKREGVAFQC